MIARMDRGRRELLVRTAGPMDRAITRRSANTRKGSGNSPARHTAAWTSGVRVVARSPWVEGDEKEEYVEERRIGVDDTRRLALTAIAHVGSG